MSSRGVVATVVTLGLLGCRGVWGLGDAPSDLASEGAGAADRPGSTAEAGGGESAPASSGATTGTGGSGSTAAGGSSGATGGGSPGEAPCGACDVDEQCGGIPGEGRCNEGRCARAAWQISFDARGLADRFVVTDTHVVVVVDEGVVDREELPHADNKLVIVERANGHVVVHPFEATSVGTLAVAPSGRIAYAPRAPDEDGATQLVVVGVDGSTAPWPGADPTMTFRGLRWDALAADGGAFHAIMPGEVGDKLVRFGAGDLELCDESDDILPRSRLWASASATSRVLVADELAIAHSLATLSLDANACEEAALSTGSIGGTITARPTALVADEGFVVTLLESVTEVHLVIAEENGEVVLDEVALGRALEIGDDGVYAVRDERLSVFSAAAPETATPLASFLPNEPIEALVSAGDALFAVTIDSNFEARLVCGLVR